MSARAPGTTGLGLFDAAQLKIIFALALVVGAFLLGLAVDVPPLLLVLGAVALAATFAFLVRTELASYTVIAILYSNAAAVAANQHGLPAFIALAFPLLLVIPLGERLLLRREPVIITPAVPFLVVYLIVVLISAAASARPSSTMDAVITFLVGGFGLYLVLTNVLRDMTMLRRAVWTVLAIGAAASALSLVQSITGSYGNDFLGFAQIEVPGRGSELRDSLESTPRTAGPVGEVNRYAQVLLVLLPIGALLAAGEPDRKLRWLANGLTVLIFFGMATTFSRGAIIGFVGVLLGAALLRYVRPMHIVLLVLAAALALASFPRLTDRLVNLQAITGVDRAAAGSVQGDANNLRSRTTSALAALFAFVDNPVLGLGPGQFPANYHRYAGEVAAASIDTRIKQEERQAHNLYTGVAAELGAVGLLAFLGIFAATMQQLYRARRKWLKARPDVAHLASGFLLGLVGYLVSGVGLHLSYERYLWLLLALAGVAGHLAMSIRAPADELRSIAVQPVGVSKHPPEAGRLRG